MNKARRLSLNKAILYLTDASDIISSASEEEQDSLDNMPENLRQSDRCLEMENIVDTLEDIASNIVELTESLESIVL